MTSPRTLRAVIAVLICSWFAAGCSAPKVRPAPALSKSPLRTLAVLPPTAAAASRERLAALREALENELSNSGFNIIDHGVVDTVCSDDACPRRHELTAKYPLDGFVQLTVRSAARTNFVAGYYNSISGELAITDTEGLPLLTIEHTESERGGLLFNSGQLIEGVITQIRNSDDDSFANLAAKFAQTIVTHIPAPVGAPPSVAALEIEHAMIAAESDSVYRVCFDGSARAFGYLVLKNKQRSNLREVGSGRYCGNYLVADPSQFAGAELEIRSAFGDARAISLGALPPEASGRCDGELALTTTNGRATLASPCPQVTAAVLIYRAPSEIGPFVKVAEARGSQWIDRSTTKGALPVYALIAVDKNGIMSTPKIASTSPKEAAQ